MLVIAQVVLAVYAFMYSGDLAAGARDVFQKFWDSSLSNPNDRQTLEIINNLQRGLQCCGPTGPRDWTNRPAPPNTVPTSCCTGDAQTCDINTANQNGCNQLLFDFVKGSGLLIAWIAIVFAGFEVRRIEFS